MELELGLSWGYGKGPDIQKYSPGSDHQGKIMAGRKSISGLIQGLACALGLRLGVKWFNIELGLLPPIDHADRVRAIVRRVRSRPKHGAWQDCGWVQVYGQLGLGLVRV